MRAKRNQAGATRYAALTGLLALAACSPNAVDSTQIDEESVQQSLLGHNMVLPKGFSIAVFAQNLTGVRLMVLGPEGAVYASDVDGSKIVKMFDADHNGVADGITTVHTGLSQPHGMAFRGDTLYVAETNRVVRFPTATAAAQVIVPSIPTGGHSSRTIVFRGDTLYVSIGSSCNICDESDQRRAAVTAYRPDGSGEQVYSRGLRNSVGLAVHPGTNEIWATNNDRDSFGCGTGITCTQSDDVPPDRVNILKPGGFFGWPNCYLPGKPNPEYAANQGPCANAIAPAVQLGAHVAPLGLTFYTGTVFPAQFRGALFVAEHGSWNRTSSAGPVGYQVQWVPVANGKPSGDPRRFISGWLDGTNAWGRPVDVLSLPDGSMLISDDAGGRIYRVTYTGS